MSSKSRRTTLGVLNNRRASMMTTASSGLPSGTSSSSSNSTKPKIKSRMSMAPRISSSSNNNNNNSDQGRAATPNARRKSYGSAENRRKTIMPSVPSSSLSNNHNNNNINSTTSNAVKTETRPISDKKYINSCIRKLHNYLITHNYENPVKLKDLTRPSAKDFHNFVTFLLQKVDPSFPYDDSSTGSSSSNSTRKIEDDIALAFKALGYPFSISKTALVAAGSPHTWPTLLLALTWLIELLDCTEEEDFNFYHRRRPRRAVRKEIQIDQNGEEVEVDVEEEEDDYDDDDTITFEEIAGEPGLPMTTLEELENRTEIAFVNYVEMSYEYFLAGDDENSDQLEEALLAYMEKDNMVIENEIEQATEENAEIMEATNDVGREMEDLPVRQQRLEELATDIEKFHELVRQLNDHKTALTQKVEERSEELQKMNDVLQKKEKQVSEYKNIVETQKLSVEDVNKIENEQNVLQMKIDKALRVNKEYDESTLQSLADLKKSFARLEVLSQNTYNDKAEEIINMIQDRSSRNGGDSDDKIEHITIDPKMDYTDETEDQSKMLGGVDFEGKIIPLLNKRKSELSALTLQMKKNVLQMTDQIGNGNSALVEVKNSIEAYEVQKQRIKERLEKEKNEDEAALALRLREVALIEEKIKSNRDPVSLESSIAKCQRQCMDLEALRQKHQDENLARKQAVMREINEALRVGANHKAYQEKVIEEVKGYMHSTSEKPKLGLSAKDEELLGTD